MPLLGSSARITLGQSPRQPRGSDPRFPSSPVSSPHTDHLNLEGKGCILGTHLPVLEIGQLPPGGAGQGHSDGNGSASGGSSGALVPGSRLILERLPAARERPLVGPGGREGACDSGASLLAFRSLHLLLLPVLSAGDSNSACNVPNRPPATPALLGVSLLSLLHRLSVVERLSKTTTLDREPRRLASCVDS